MASHTKPLLLVLLGALLALLAFPLLLDGRPDVRGVLDVVAAGSGEGKVQSSSQLSAVEFESIRPGSTPAQLEALVGDPADRHSTEVEGVALECWYYGVGGATGAYQFCFAGDRLVTKLRYGRR